MRLTQPLSIKLADDDAERVRRSHAQAIAELQREIRGLTTSSPPRWELIERRLLSSADDEIAFGRLDGDSDQEYLLRARLIDSTTTNGTYDLTINGAVVGHSQEVVATGATTTATAYASSIPVARGSSASTAITSFEGVLLASRGGYRIYRGSSVMLTSTGGAVTVVGGAWTDTTTLVTSVGILRSATTMDADSWAEIYRRAL